MKKIKLMTGEVKYKDLEFAKEQFEFPKRLRVDFSTATIRNVYDRSNGENTKTDKVEKVVCHGRDEQICALLEGQGLDIDGLTTMPFEIVDNWQEVIGFIEGDKNKVLEIQDYAIKPKWVKTGEKDGRVFGEYKDVVLAVRKFKVVNNE